MKYCKLIFLSFLFVFCINGCNKRTADRDIALWNKFPSEKFFSYTDNLKRGSQTFFLDDNNNAIQFSIDYYDSLNLFVFVAPQEDYYGYLASTGEHFYFSIYDGISFDNWTFNLYGDVYNRYFLLFYLTINMPDVKLEAQFYRETPYDENYMPYDADKIATYLSDTINMYNRQNEYVAKLVAGKGLVSFIDTNGVKWEAAE